MMGENESRCPLIRFVHHYLMLVSFMCVLCLEFIFFDVPRSFPLVDVFQSAHFYFLPLIHA